MRPVSRDPSTDNIADADVVEDLDASATGETTVEAPATGQTTVEAPLAGETTVEAPASGEAVQGMPVLSEVRTVAAPSPALLPTVQAAAVAATGFVAGAATLALVKRHSARKLARSRQSRRALDALPIVGSRSFLVDVHLIAKPGE